MDNIDKSKDLKINLQERLYNNLPNIYLSEDAKHGYALKKVLSVLGVGFNELEQYVKDLSNAYDLDKCPANFLPLIAQLYGVEFPYSFDVATQRKFLKVIPLLYANKGTDVAFKYLAREIFGQATVTNSWTADRGDISLDDWINSDEWKKLFVKVEVDGETFQLDDKANQFIKFSEIIRPVNTILIPYIVFFYQDKYDKESNIKELYDLAILYCDDKLETIKQALDQYDSSTLSMQDEELYKTITRFPTDSNPFLINLDRLNSAKTLGAYNDLTIISHVPEEEVITSIRYDVDVSSNTHTNDSDSYLVDVTYSHGDTTTITDSINVDRGTDSYDLGTLTPPSTTEVLLVWKSDDKYLLDTSVYTDSENFNRLLSGDELDKLDVVNTRFSHLGGSKLTTEFRTTDFISTF